MWQSGRGSLPFWAELGHDTFYLRQATSGPTCAGTARSLISDLRLTSGTLFVLELLVGHFAHVEDLL